MSSQYTSCVKTMPKSWTPGNDGSIIELIFLKHDVLPHKTSNVLMFTSVHRGTPGLNGSCFWAILGEFTYGISHKSQRSYYPPENSQFAVEQAHLLPWLAFFSMVIFHRYVTGHPPVIKHGLLGLIAHLDDFPTQTFIDRGCPFTMFDYLRVTNYKYPILHNYWPVLTINHY
jgi:hypothetical protein